MRKSFLTKEYSIEGIPGTFSMKEQRAFFGSKILEIEDVMRIGNNNINWTESVDNTQGIILENINKSFDSEIIKKNNHSIRVYPLQSDEQKRDFTRWELTFNIREMIRIYLFSKLKSNRIFKNIENKNTINNSIDSAINDYIIYNIYPRIGFLNIVLYVKYYKIGEIQDYSVDNIPVIALQYDNRFREELITPSPMGGESNESYNNRINTYRESLKIKNFQLTTDPNQDTATIIYKQTQSSLSYKFDYYFDVIWQKV